MGHYLNSYIKFYIFTKRRKNNFWKVKPEGGGGCMALDLNPNIFINIKIEIFH